MKLRWPRRWLADLAFGGRLVIAGGRPGWARAAATTLGVGLAMALLLLAAAVPAVLAANDRRALETGVPSDESLPAAAEDTLLVERYESTFRGQQVRGLAMWPEGPSAPVPPGVAQLPGDGEVVVSPALAALLDSPEGDLLRPRVDHRQVGRISEEGLRNPRDLTFYLGDGGLDPDHAHRIDRFGESFSAETDPLHPVLVLLVTVGLVVLLLPVAMFVAVAVRFGGEHRDRRLAAIRLVGADAAMTRRIAAGEALFASLLGLLTGIGFFLLGRELIGGVTLGNISVFASDVRPHPGLAAVVLAAVPLLAVAVTMLAMRALAVEPLGVFRRAGRLRRRLWWRLLLPTAGLALLYPLVGRAGAAGAAENRHQVAAGVVLLLLGVAALLPWLVDVLVRRMRGRGTVSWLLATRRLQGGGGSSMGRVVNGVAVAAAGTIALLMFFGAAQDQFVQEAAAVGDREPAEVRWRESTDLDAAEEMAAHFAATTGVLSAEALTSLPPTVPHGTQVTIGRCPALVELVEVDRCTDGDVFVVDHLAGAPPSAGGPPEPGDQLEFPTDLARAGAAGRLSPQPAGDPEQSAELATRSWEVPESARSARWREQPLGSEQPDLLATPGAVADLDLAGDRATVRIGLAGDPDAIEHVRNTAAGIDRTMWVRDWQPTQEDAQFRTVRRGLLLGATLTLGLIGASLLVTTVEQLRERRRQLAMLVAVGTKRRTLALSVMWQTVLPMTLGLLLALGIGIGLGNLLLAVVNEQAVIRLADISAVAGIAAGVVLLVSLLTLPALWRLTRPDGLRTE